MKSNKILQRRKNNNEKINCLYMTYEELMFVLGNDIEPKDIKFLSSERYKDLNTTYYIEIR